MKSDETEPTIPVTVSEFDGNQTIRYKPGDVIETDDPTDRVLGYVVEAPRNAQKCLLGEHEADGAGRHYMAFRSEENGHDTSIQRIKEIHCCRHCRCLFVKKEKL